jgi:putative transposase
MTIAEQAIVEHIIRQTTNPQWLVTRAKIVLKAANGQSTRGIAGELGLTRNTVRLWRERWQATATKRAITGTEAAEQTELRKAIELSLRDEYRRGGPMKFTAEQVVQIVAISCEDITASEYPVSHWTPKEVAAEAMKRGIVSQISTRQVGRFLKRGGSQTPLEPLLAEYDGERSRGLPTAEQDGV